MTHRSACCSSPWDLVSGLPQRWAPRCLGSDGLLLGSPVSLGQFSFSTTSAVSHCVCLAFFRYISYPRTETNIFPKDLDLAALVEQQIPDPRWGAFARNILEHGGPTPRNGNKSDQAHPPIHPTKYTDSLQVGIPGRLPRDPQGGQGSGLGSSCSVGSDFRNSVTENLSLLWGRDVISTLSSHSLRLVSLRDPTGAVAHPGPAARCPLPPLLP